MTPNLKPIHGSLLMSIVAILAASCHCLSQTIAQLKVTMGTPYYSPTPGYIRIDLQVSAGIGYVTNYAEYNGANLNGSWEVLNLCFTSTATPALVNTDFTITSSVAGISSGSVSNVSAGGCYISQAAFNITFTRASPAADAGSTPLKIATIDFPKNKGGSMITGLLSVRATTIASCASRETFWSNSNSANSGARLSGTGNSVTLGVYSILPIELESFEGKLIGKLTQLTWVSASEQNISHFAIEYAKDGINFLQIGLVQATSTSNSKKKYKYIHAVPEFANNYYRLKMADNDGSFTYSKIINVFLAGKQTKSVYPNPASEYIVVSHPASSDFAQLTLFDMAGNLVKKVTISRNTNETKMNIASIGRGMYKIMWNEGSTIKCESLIIH